MKIIFFGSDIFAVPSLKALTEGRYEVAAVVTQTDKQKGRHLKVGYSAVKSAALDLGLKILQPDNVNSAEFVKTLKVFHSDLLVVAAYGKILNQDVLDIPRIMPINVHGSLLPKYRGAAPINWAIINGEKQAGVTLIKMSEKMDAGEIIAQGSLRIEENDTSASLREKLAETGATTLIATLEKIKRGINISLKAQDEKEASFAPKLKKSDGLIDWSKPAEKIHNMIRGMQPWPGCFTYYKGKVLKIWESSVIDSREKRRSDGEVVEIGQDGILVATGKGLLRLEEVQLESGKRMLAKEFISGHHLKVGDHFE